MRLLTALSIVLASGCYGSVVEDLESTAGTSTGGSTSTGTPTTGGSSTVATSSAGAATTTAAASTTAASTSSSGSASTAAGATSGIASSTSGTTAAASSTSGGSTSGGSTSGAACALTDCPAGQVEIKGALVNLCQNGSPVNEDGTVVNTLGMSQMGTLDYQGNFYFCLPPGTQLAASLTFTNYEPTLFATIDAEQSACLGAIPLICSSIATYLPYLLPGFDASQAAVVVATSPESTTGPCATLSGWSYSLMEFGTEGLDAGGVASVSSSGVSPGGVTGATGILLYYNLVPQVGPITSVAGTPPAGATCPFIGGQPPDQLTGSVDLQGGVVSYFPYVVQ